MAGPLSGIRILDMTWVLSGPFATMVLCDLGAEVIKVERPGTGDQSRQAGPFVNGVSLYFVSVNRGKKSAVLDLTSKSGKDEFLELVKQFDVLVENFVPGTMARLGLGYDTLKVHNPRLIYAACSGFGQTGPYRDKPAVDVIVQGMGGIMSITGDEDGPPARVGISIGDIGAGLFLAIGILSAVIERARSGLGQMVDVAMLDTQVALMENAFVRYLNTGEIPRRLGTRHPVATPFQAFQTSDGHIVISVAGGIEQWAAFTQLIGLPDLLSDARFHDRTVRTKHHKILEPILAEALRKRTTGEWLKALEAIGVPCGPLQTIPEAAVDPQIIHRDMFVDIPDPTLGKVKVCNTPLRFSRTPGIVRDAAPLLGEHTNEILGR